VKSIFTFLLQVNPETRFLLPTSGINEIPEVCPFSDSSSASGRKLHGLINLPQTHKCCLFSPSLYISSEEGAKSRSAAASGFHKTTRLIKSTGFLLQINRVLAGIFLDKNPLI
jgi:hypothetical protein